MPRSRVPSHDSDTLRSTFVYPDRETPPRVAGYTMVDQVRAHAPDTSRAGRPRRRSRSEAEADAAACGQAVLAAERELAARARTVVVDHAVEAGLLLGAGRYLAAVQRGAAIAAAADLEIRAAIADVIRLRLDRGIAARDLDRVVRGAAACAAGLAVERGLFAPTTDFRTFWDTLSGDVL